jgi:putative phosphoesterase
MRVGLVSDTHGRLPREVLTELAGVDRIIHAGDIGPYSLLLELERIAPVTAVCGNTDRYEIRDRVPDVAEIDLMGYSVAVMHGHQLGTPTPAGLRAALPDARVIVYGHTHQPRVDREEGVLIVNPGSASVPRLGLGPSVAILGFDPEPDVELIRL